MNLSTLSGLSPTKSIYKIVDKTPSVHELETANTILLEKVIILENQLTNLKQWWNEEVNENNELRFKIVELKLNLNKN